MNNDFQFIYLQKFKSNTVMKKIIITLAMLVAVGAYAQKVNRTTAFNYHKEGKLDKAKEYIDKASENPETATDARTWFYKGNIYLDIFMSPIDKYKGLDPDPLNVSYQAYTKALQFDAKKEYEAEIASRMPILAERFFNEGASNYNNKNYTASMAFFQKAYDIYKVAGQNDTTSLYYLAISAEMADNNEVARNALDQLIKMDYKNPNIYASMSSLVMKTEKNDKKAMEYITVGRQKFPDDFSLIIAETNFFLATDQTEKALANLQLASQKDTTNPTIFFAIGAKYNELADDTLKKPEERASLYERAESAYIRSIRLDPNYFDANYNMGALFVNKASDIIKRANQLPLSAEKEYNQLKLEADNMLKNALPYLEKSHQLKPEDRPTMASLKEIYTRLQMYDKLKDINTKLGG